MTDQATPPANDLSTKASAIAADIQTIADDAAIAVKAVANINWWTALKGFLTALPGIILLIKNFMAWVNAVSGNNPQAFISNLGDAFASLSAAKTQEDRQNAAQKLAAAINKLPS